LDSTITSPLDLIKSYKDAGVSVLVWKPPGNSGTLHSEGLSSKLVERGFKAETLAIPEPPPGYPAPPYYPELTLTILDPSIVDAVLGITSDRLQETFQAVNKVTVKIDVVLDQRFVSVEANGVASDVGKTIKGIPKIEKLASSNLVAIVAQHESDKPTMSKFCSKCGATIPAQSEFCYKCGQRQ
jgi:ribosomal protein L40E